MAYNRFPFLAIAMILLPTIAIATEYIVGDGEGWTVGFDYQAWAKDKMFNVGDSLVFQYTRGDHDVYKIVNGTDFKECIIPKDAEVLTSGNDTVVLKTEGNKWYFCGKPNHCSNGQKLSISVMNMNAPAPSQNSAPRGNIFTGFQVFVAVFVLLMAVN